MTQLPSVSELIIGTGKYPQQYLAAPLVAHPSNPPKIERRHSEQTQLRSLAAQVQPQMALPQMVQPPMVQPQMVHQHASQVSLPQQPMQLQPHELHSHYPLPSRYAPIRRLTEPSIQKRNSISPMTQPIYNDPVTTPNSIASTPNSGSDYFHSHPNYKLQPESPPTEGQYYYQQQQMHPNVSYFMTNPPPGYYHPQMMMNHGIFEENNALVNKRRIIKRRTRTGCLTCGKRRIKCDERKPACFNCERSKKVCLGYENLNMGGKKKRDTSLDIGQTVDDDDYEDYEDYKRVGETNPALTAYVGH